MQKVITVHSLTQFDSDNHFMEVKYPELNSLLDTGWTITQTIPFKDTQTAFFSITFILQKD